MPSCGLSLLILVYLHRHVRPFPCLMIDIINIHDAKTHLSRLVEDAAAGEPFIIAKAGRPMVKVVALEAPAAPQRLGFLAGELVVPADFDRMGAEEIAALFGAEG